MDKIVWDDKYNIGVEVVDKAHAKLFHIVGRLMDISQDDKTTQHTYKEGLKYLEAYSMTHFSEEEAYMRSIRYSGYAEHKRTHDNFRDKTLVALKKDLEMSDYSQTAMQHFAEVMSNWLAEHIMREDQAIVGRVMTRKGFDISAQVPIITRVVNRAMQEVFQTEAKLATADYKGQNIGKGLYCHRYYDTESGLRIQFLLGVEETLFLRGVSRILGTQVTHMDETMEEVTLQVFEQVLQHMSKLFRIEKEHEFEKENLLTRDGFRTSFMKGYPCNLLYSTKIGYFVFCYRSWRLKKKA